ncbi:transposase [Trinickia mobilis]|uniref:transposase n=1 Tax=Trinickia mobilis TaxID=2816356 RepID=UPI001A8CB2D5|nr:transposase [Trinickia mobilis]
MKPGYTPLSDAEWAKVESFFEHAPFLVRRPRVDSRVCVDAVLHVLTLKCGWNNLPDNRGYPAQATVYRRFDEWRKTGALDRAMKMLEKAGRRFNDLPEAPKEKPKAASRFRAEENIKAMQDCCLARLMSGIPADWKCEV